MPASVGPDGPLRPVCRGPIAGKGEDPRDPLRTKGQQCFVGDDDIGQYMVVNGFAKANAAVTERYTGHEAQAKAQRRGLWETGSR